jgi:hypothetical protein
MEISCLDNKNYPNAEKFIVVYLGYEYDICMRDEIFEIPANLLHLYRHCEPVSAGLRLPDLVEVGQDLHDLIPVPPLHVDPAISTQVHSLPMELSYIIFRQNF